jgi:hypothetical protein
MNDPLPREFVEAPDAVFSRRIKALIDPRA